MNCGCKIVEMPMMASSQGGEYIARHIEFCPLHAAAEKLRDALQTSVTALDDWLNIHAADHCDETRVAEARERVHECGTIAYIARVQDANETALAAAQGTP